VLDYFPEYKDLQTAERRKIRLKDLLSMTSGLHWDENTYPYTDAETARPPWTWRPIAFATSFRSDRRAARDALDV